MAPEGPKAAPRAEGPGRCGPGTGLQPRPIASRQNGAGTPDPGACKKSVGGYIRSRYAAPIIPASLPRAARRIGGVPMASEAITYPGVLRFSRSVR